MKFETEAAAKKYVSDMLFKAFQEMTPEDLVDLASVQPKAAAIIGCEPESVTWLAPYQDKHVRRWGLGVENWPFDGNRQAVMGAFPGDPIGEMFKRHRQEAAANG